MQTLHAVPTIAQLWTGSTPPFEAQRLTPRQQDKRTGWALVSIPLCTAPWWGVFPQLPLVANADPLALTMAIIGLLFAFRLLLELPLMAAKAMPAIVVLASVLMARSELLAVRATANWWDALGRQLFGA